MIYKMNCVVYIEAEGDPEEIASAFGGGFSHAVRGFPDGDVLMADVEMIQVAPEEEIEEHELRESLK